MEICLLLIQITISGEYILRFKNQMVEGESVTLSCTYDTSSSYVYLYWYRQYPNTEPQYLLWKGARSNGGEHKIEQRFRPATSQTSTELTIDSVTLSDSALYYCALRVEAQ
uniref:Ig-like domain-containing protein n=1 Tax=Sinocyclocheilus rhinocerous TaxID=307959 RepID=A0A673J8Z7_9TELE